MINEQTSQTLVVLTVVTVLALPLTIIPGMFGMKVRGIPFSEHDAGFWLVLVVVVAVVRTGAAIAWTRYRTRRDEAHRSRLWPGFVSEHVLPPRSRRVSS